METTTKTVTGMKTGTSVGDPMMAKRALEAAGLM